MTSKSIDFEKIKQIVQNPNEKLQIALKQSNVQRNTTDWTLHNNNVDKIYRMVYDKRDILPNLYTIPFGYRLDENDFLFSSIFQHILAWNNYTKNLKKNYLFPELVRQKLMKGTSGVKKYKE